MTDDIRDRIGRAIHDRAHRPGGGGIDCYDADLPVGHPPCYLIAAEVADSLPSRALDPSRDVRDGWATGADRALGHLDAWSRDWEMPSQGWRDAREHLADRIGTLRQRIKRGDADWMRTEDGE